MAVGRVIGLTTHAGPERRPEMLCAAQWYARRGHPIFPLHSVDDRGHCTCGDSACGRSVAKHPRTRAGLLDATTDPAQIERYWRRWPDANIGLRTGALAVVDVDPRNGGDDGLLDLERQIGELPETVTVNTGGGGLHFYFASPGAVPSRSNLGGFAGVDLKADGGYVVAAPSLHASGRRYEFDAVLHPSHIVPVPLPEALAELARKDPPRAVGRVGFERGAWDGSLPPKLLEAIAFSDRLNARFFREAAGLADRSPSGVDYSLACVLAVRHFSGAEIEAALRTSRAAAGLPEKPASYFGATVSKALGLAAERGLR